jgi:hypothetical protein
LEPGKIIDAQLLNKSSLSWFWNFEEEPLMSIHLCHFPAVKMCKMKNKGDQAGWQMFNNGFHGLINYKDTKAKCHHLKN